MAFGNPYAAYQTTAVKTASQGKLVVMLYQGAEKELTSAQKCFDSESKIPASKIESFGKHIMKAQEIINELQVSLDMDKGGQIAQNLMSLYVFFNKELMDVSIKQDKDKLTGLLDMIKQLGSAWEAAAANTQADSIPQAQRTLNITG
ncbi:flagellar export chaperone FliS [Treponema sp.]|uniref:flagellar export chaperone FliS n=1 Tax=Treponema sp. TaxID=166 RepID=UPI00388D031D